MYVHMHQTTECKPLPRTTAQISSVIISIKLRSYTLFINSPNHPFTTSLQPRHLLLAPVREKSTMAEDHKVNAHSKSKYPSTITPADDAHEGSRQSSYQ